MEINPAKRAGTILRLLREDSGKTQAELAREAQSSATMISYLENGEKAGTGDLISRIGRALGHEKALVEIWGFTTNSTSSYTEAAELLVTHEAEATKIHDWDLRVVPGLLQTEAYARAVIRASLPLAPNNTVDDLVSKRMARQRTITRDNPPVLWTVLDEGILHRPYGGKDVLREQLARLEETTQQPGIFIQVMPFTAVHSPGLEGPLRIIELKGEKPLCYNDGWKGSGRISDDPDEVADARMYFDLIKATALSPQLSAELIAGTRSMI
jgi:transcriptional regulator with XRE-family HTH domain